MISIGILVVGKNELDLTQKAIKAISVPGNGCKAVCIVLQGVCTAANVPVTKLLQSCLPFKLQCNLHLRELYLQNCYCHLQGADLRHQLKHSPPPEMQ